MSGGNQTWLTVGRLAGTWHAKVRRRWPSGKWGSRQQSARWRAAQRQAHFSLFSLAPVADPSVCVLQCGLQGMSPAVTSELHDDVVLWVTPLGELAGESVVSDDRAHPLNHTQAR